jgi:hypothetical protein
MHHPFSWLRDHEEPVLHRELTLNCGFIHVGHQHRFSFGVAPFDDKALLLSAGATHIPEKVLFYNIVC